MLSIGCLAAVVATLTSLPFLFRIRAVFNGSMFSVALFSILWMIQLLSSLAIPLSIRSHAQSTNECTSTRPVTAAYTVISPLVFLLRDTCVFVAISARLMTHSREATGAMMTWRKYLASFFSRRDKQLISRAVLETGQIYYLYACHNAMLLFLLTCGNQMHRWRNHCMRHL